MSDGQQEDVVKPRRRRRALIAVAALVSIFLTAGAWEYAQALRVSRMLQHIASEAEAERVAKSLSSGSDIRRLTTHVGDNSRAESILIFIGAPAVKSVADKAKTLHNWRAAAKRTRLGELWAGVRGIWAKPPMWSNLPVGPVNYSDRSDRLFSSCSTVLSWIGDPAVDELLSMTKSHDETTRLIGVNSLALMVWWADEHDDVVKGFHYSADKHNAQLEAVFAEALGAPRVEMRRAGAYGLAHMPSTRAREALLVALTDSDSLVLESAGKALAMSYGTEAAVVDRLLLTLVDPSAAGATRAAAAAGLAAADEPRVREALLAALDDTSECVRIQAAAALAARSDEHAVSVAIGGLGSPDKNLRDGAYLFLFDSLGTQDGVVKCLAAAYDAANVEAQKGIVKVLADFSRGRARVFAHATNKEAMRIREQAIRQNKAADEAAAALRELTSTETQAQRVGVR